MHLFARIMKEHASHIETAKRRQKINFFADEAA